MDVIAHFSILAIISLKKPLRDKSPFFPASLFLFDDIFAAIRKFRTLDLVWRDLGGESPDKCYYFIRL